MGLLENKSAFVTGGSAGIGRAIVEAYLREGARVVVGSRNPDSGRKLLDELDAGDALHFVPTDVTRQSDVEALVDRTVALLGGLDVAVLNAGGVGTSAPILRMSDEEWRFELDVNLNHTFWGMRAALRHLTEQGSGRVITMSSIEGKHAKPGVAGYVANKHAINGLTKAVAKEVGTSGVTVNAICPGLVLTDLPRSREGQGLGVGSFQAVIDIYSREAALQRPVTVEEVAAAAVFLASDGASGITGTLLSVDGGTAHY
jgi:3-hydroxybutyrate dehydrogenase